MTHPKNHGAKQGLIFEENNQNVPVCSVCMREIEESTHRVVIFQDMEKNLKVKKFHYFFPCWDMEYICQKYPDYKIIPGHGKITGMKNYLYFADYLKYLRKEVSAGIKAGKDAGAIMKENKLDGFKKIKDKGFFTTRKNNILWMYQELTRKKK